MPNKMNKSHVNVFLSEADARLLTTMTIFLKQNKSTIIRDLIRARFKELGIRAIQSSDFVKQSKLDL